MIKRKEGRLIKSLLIVGSILPVFLMATTYNYNPKENKTNEFKKMVKLKEPIKDSKFNEEDTQKEEYIATIEIPKINLKTNMVDINSKSNNVNKHVQIIKGSDMPNKINGNFILAAHSGTSNLSYFKNLYKLSISDTIYIYYSDVKYTYKIYDIYKIDKDGTVEIKRDYTKTMLTLTTCDSSNDKKQLVILASRIE